MLRTFNLLLPALLPSWRFFDFIVASPRIQYALLDLDKKLITEWQEFRPRPARVSLPTMLLRLFWNAEGNESLFIMSCAERLMAEGSAQCEQEILLRMINAWRFQQLPGPDASLYIQFRLQFVHRINAQLHKEVRFTSRHVPLPERA